MVKLPMGDRESASAPYFFLLIEQIMNRAGAPSCGA
jgi:hypothetical protein